MKLLALSTFIAILLLFAIASVSPYISDPCYSVIEGKGPSFKIKGNRVCMVYVGSGMSPRKTKTLEGADAKTFKQLGYRYFVDKSHVYYDNEIIEDLDPVLLEEMGNNYYRDNRNIVYSGKILDKADYETFEILDENSYSAKDKNHMYKWGRIIK